MQSFQALTTRSLCSPWTRSCCALWRIQATSPIPACTWPCDFPPTTARPLSARVWVTWRLSSTVIWRGMVLQSCKQHWKQRKNMEQHWFKERCLFLSPWNIRLKNHMSQKQLGQLNYNTQYCINFRPIVTYISLYKISWLILLPVGIRYKVISCVLRLTARGNVDFDQTKRCSWAIICCIMWNTEYSKIKDKNVSGRVYIVSAITSISSVLRIWTLSLSCKLRLLPKLHGFPSAVQRHGQLGLLCC